MTKTGAISILKWAVTLGLIWAILSHVDIAALVRRVDDIAIGPAVAALALLAIQLAITAERCRRVGAVYGVALRFGDILRNSAIGTFFNQALPSGFGGDSVRVWLTVRDARRRAAPIGLGPASSIILGDRVLSLLQLVALVALALPWLGGAAGAAIVATLQVIAAMSALGVAGLILGGALLPRLRARLPVLRTAIDLISNFRKLLLDRRMVAIGALGFATHGLTIAVVWLLARAIGLPLALLGAACTAPAVLLATAIPISIAGWGVREVAAISLFAVVGLPAGDAAALSIAFGAALVAASLPGGALWLGLPAELRRRGARAQAEPSALKALALGAPEMPQPH